MNQSGYADLLNTSSMSADTIVVGILNLPNLNANSVAIIDSSNDLSDILLNDGQLVIGKTGLAPVAASLTGTTNEIIVTNGPGTITLTTPQAIATTSSPTFANITINGSIAGPINTRTADNILSCSTAQTTGDLIAFSAAQRVVVDTGLLATNIVTNTGTGAAGNIPSFVSSKVIQDSNIAATNIFLADGTVAATGNFNMNAKEITGIAALRPTATNILFGTGATSTSLRDIAIGSTNAIIGSSNDTISIGSNMTLNSFIANNVLIGNNITCLSGGSETVCIGQGASTSAGVSNVIIGQNTSVTGTGFGNVVIGQLSSTSNNDCSIIGTGSNISGNGVIAIGAGCNTASSKAHMLGATLTNSTANSLLIDASANIRSNNNNSTDLGTATALFKDVYASGSLIGAVKTSAIDSIVTGPASVTSGNLASYNGTSGKVIQDGNIALVDVFLRTGTVPMTGALNLNTNNVTNGGVINVTNITDASSVSTGSIITAGGIGVAKKAYIGDSVFVNTTSATAKIVVSGGVQNVLGEDSCIRAISSSAATKIELNNTSGPGKIYEVRSLNNGAFDITDRTGSNTPFTINTSGNMSTNGIFTDSNVTDSSSSTTGAIISSGGIGVAKSLVVGTNISAQGTTDSTSSSTGTILCSGGIGVIKTLTAGGKLISSDTTDSTTTTTGSIQGAGGLGLAKAITAGGIIKTTDTTDASSTTTGSLQCAGGIGCAKQIQSAGKVTVSTSAGAIGLDLATADSYSNLRVIQNTTNATDKHIYIGFQSGATSSILMYSNNALVLKVETGGNLGLNGASYGGGVGVIFIANRATVPTSNPTGGGILYCESGALKYRGSGGTTTTVANA